MFGKCRCVSAGRRVHVIMSVHAGAVERSAAYRDRRRRAFVPIKGEIPSPLAPPSGCHFHPRCPQAMPRCSTEVPPLREIAPARWSACHLNDVRKKTLQ